MKKLITELPYDDVEFKFVADHYDIHLNGTCIYKNRLCEFSSEYPDFNVEKDEWEKPVVKIFELSFFQKLNWTLKQFIFELCVGKHWTYKNGKRSSDYYIRRPKWLHELLIKIYYSKSK